MSSSAATRGIKKIPNYLKRDVRVEKISTKWSVVHFGDSPQGKFDFESFIQHNGSILDQQSSICEFAIGPDEPLASYTLTDTWRSLLDEDVIPFDLQQRRSKCQRAYENLDDYVKKHEALRALTK